MSSTVGCSDEKKLWVSGEMWVRDAVGYGGAIAVLIRLCGIYAEMDGLIHRFYVRVTIATSSDIVWAELFIKCNEHRFSLWKRTNIFLERFESMHSLHIRYIHTNCIIHEG
jgi:hypothetical protein